MNEINVGTENKPLLAFFVSDLSSMGWEINITQAGSLIRIEARNGDLFGVASRSVGYIKDFDFELARLLVTAVGCAGSEENA